MVSEVWRPPGRAQIEKKHAPKPVQKTAPKFVRFFAISAAQMDPKWVPNRIQNRSKNGSENGTIFEFNVVVHGGPRR